MEETNVVLLPREIVYDILSRLPIRSLVQFKCVCKQWRSIIQNVALHHTRAQARHDGSYLIIAFITNSSSEVCFFSANYEGGAACQVLTHPEPGSYNISGSVNGLMCGYPNSLDSIFLCNPSTREIVTLPASSLKSNASNGDNYKYIPTYAFGFDARSKQYKVLNVCKVVNFSEENVSDLGTDNGYACEIFTLGTQSWRKLNVVPPTPYGINDDYCCVNGAIHWKINKRDILAFDIEGEKFQVIPLPDGPSDVPFLVEIGGRLAALDYFYVDNTWEIWILRDYDNWIWIKESISLPFDWIEVDRPCPVGAIQTDEIVLKPIMTVFSRLLSVYYYDLKTKCSKKIDITGIPESKFYKEIEPVKFCVTNLVESLFRLQDI